MFDRMRNMMERQVKHLVRLVDDLLDVSRISRGKIDLRKERVDLATALNHAVDTSQPAIEEARHKLTVTLPPEPFYVEGDPTRLVQVVSNLLHNAAKYTPAGGHISLSMEREDAEMRTPFISTTDRRNAEKKNIRISWAVIRVRDNGLGIPREMVTRIFDMFVQIEEHRGKVQGGLGIGLSLVHSLVHMHGGMVEVHSPGLGQGSEFIVRLPLLLANPDGPGKVQGGPEEQAIPIPVRRRILVVDDSRDSADSLGVLVQALGHEVRTAYDGPSALALAETFVPDLVLLDIGMPGMDGYEVARRMRQVPSLHDTLLVAQTGWGQDEDRSRSQEAGFDCHLVKPVERTGLQTLLEAATRTS